MAFDLPLLRPALTKILSVTCNVTLVHFYTQNMLKSIDCHLVEGRLVVLLEYIIDCVISNHIFKLFTRIDVTLCHLSSYLVDPTCRLAPLLV